MCLLTCRLLAYRDEMGVREEEGDGDGLPPTHIGEEEKAEAAASPSPGPFTQAEQIGGSKLTA